MQPNVIIQQVSKECDRVIITLEVTEQLDPWGPIAPSRIWKEGQNYEDGFELHKLLRQDGKKLTLESYAIDSTPPEPGPYILFSSWTAYQLEIVKTDECDWHLHELKSSDAIETMSGKNRIRRKKQDDDTADSGALIPKGWDHEHCAFCSETICDADDDHAHTGYTNQSDDWLCPTCFEKYIRSGLGKRF
jgi:hypothetical protein